MKENNKIYLKSGQDYTMINGRKNIQAAMEESASGLFRPSKKMNANWFFLCVFAFQLFVRFQGIDFNDEGFHAAVYQQMLNDPQSVVFGFWMWLTGIIGSLILKLTPFLGIWGLRLAGALVVTGTAMIAFNLLKPFVRRSVLMTSVALLVLFMNGDAKNLYYNNFSALLYFTEAYFLFKGLAENRKFFLFLAGFMVCLNVFVRLPNLTGILMVLPIFYYSFITNDYFKNLLYRSLSFFSGFISGAVLVYLIMFLLGHLPYYIESVKMVFMSSQDAKAGDGIGGAYGIFRLFTRNAMQYILSLRLIGFTLLVILITGYMRSAASRSTKPADILVRIMMFALIALVGFAAFTGWFHSYRLLLFFTGTGLLSVFVLFDRNASPEFKLLVFTGGLIALIHPFGSSEGITTVEMYSLWISFPAAINMLSGINSFQISSTLFTRLRIMVSKLQVSGKYWKWSGIVCLSAIGIACLYNITNHPYLCDEHSRSEMLYSVNNRHMRGIFTSEGRARAIDDLLAASSRYVEPGDVVLAFDCMPMYHFMTETKSYVRNPCIWFYSTGMFEKELNVAYRRKNFLPVVIKQKILTTGEGSGWPEKKPAEDYSLFTRNQGKNNILQKFLASNHYKEVWSSAEFAIYVPPNTQSVIPK